MHLILIMTAATLTATTPKPAPPYFQNSTAPTYRSAVHKTIWPHAMVNDQTRERSIKRNHSLGGDYFRTPIQKIPASFPMLESGLTESWQTNRRQNPNLTWDFPQGFLEAEGDSPRIIFQLEKTFQTDQARTVLDVIQRARATPANDAWPMRGNTRRHLRYWLLSDEDYLVNFGANPLDFAEGIPPTPIARRSERDHTELIWNGNKFQLLIYKKVICPGRRCGGPIPARLQAVIPLRVNAALDTDNGWTLSPFLRSARMPAYIEVTQGGRVRLRRESKTSPAGTLANLTLEHSYRHPIAPNEAPTRTEQWKFTPSNQRQFCHATAVYLDFDENVSCIPK